jgi:hypothetical protein
MSCAAGSDAAPSAAAAGAAAALVGVGGAAAPSGASITTRMVPLSMTCAVFEQPWWLALPRPADAAAKVEFELMASSDKK